VLRAGAPATAAAAAAPTPLPTAAAAAAARSRRRPCRRPPAAAATGSASSAPATDAVDLDREAHKVFDEAYVSVRRGKGGSGEVVEAGRGKWVRNLKYKPGGQQAKQVWLPASEPADGADGADVVLVCDASCDTLLHLHRPTPPSRGGGAGGGGGGGGGSGGDRARATTPAQGPAATSRHPRAFVGADGAHGNPAVGSGGPKRNRDIKKARTPPLEVRVPPGTVVRRKGSGATVGELLQPGERLVVARGGRGGAGVVAPSRETKQRASQRAERRAEQAGAEVVGVEDGNWRADARGMPGSAATTLQLLLRVVADVGIVGFPNAGKSSLLAALTRAAPEVAAYPFTTLMPNLGVMARGRAGGGGGAGAGAGAGGDDEEDEEVWAGMLAQAGGGGGRGNGVVVPDAEATVLADLPGLIEGAHSGRGLGRAFLRHLRRARALLHVVDASAADPAADYVAVREELRMYNPRYGALPHVVALNKCDLEDARALRREAAGEVAAAAARLRRRARDEAAAGGGGGGEGYEESALPAAVVAVSAASGEGVRELRVALQQVLAAEAEAEARRGSKQQRRRPAGDGGDGDGNEQQPEGVIFVDGVIDDDGEEEDANEDDGDAPADGDAPESAPADDEDAWMVGLSEEELEALAAAGDEEAEEEAAAAAGKDDGDDGWGDDDEWDEELA